MNCISEALIEYKFWKRELSLRIILPPLKINSKLEKLWSEFPQHVYVCRRTGCRNFPRRKFFWIFKINFFVPLPQHKIFRPGKRNEERRRKALIKVICIRPYNVGLDPKPCNSTDNFPGEAKNCPRNELMIVSVSNFQIWLIFIRFYFIHSNSISNWISNWTFDHGVHGLLTQGLSNKFPSNFPPTPCGNTDVVTPCLPVSCICLVSAYKVSCRFVNLFIFCE